MKKIGLLLFFAVFACSLSAQNRLSVFIGNANRYASVDLSDFCRRLCVEYDISAESLNNYYRRCGRDWGHVGLALEIARTSGRSMRDICDYYRRYKMFLRHVIFCAAIEGYAHATTVYTPLVFI